MQIIKEEERHQLSEDTIGKLNEAYNLVKDETIVLASNFNGQAPEAFKGL